MRQLLCGLGVVVMLTACGDDVDPPVSEARLELGGTSVGLGGFAFDKTRVGTTARATFTIMNSGDAESGIIVAQILGDTALTIDSDSTCPGAVLAPAAACDVTLAFAPTTTGNFEGTLLFAASPGGMLSLPLGGEATPLGVVFDPPALDFGAVESGSHTSTVHITNTNSEAISVASVSINGPVFAVTTDCGASIAAGASCDATILFAARQLGVFSATLTVDTGVLASAPVTGTVGGRLDVEKAGLGSGNVSSNGAIDCGTTCTAINLTTITLTATPDGSSIFLGWSDASCGSSATCDVAADVVPRSITATFASIKGNKLRVQFAGDAGGTVQVHLNNFFFDCAGTCDVPASPGDTIQLSAVSPSNIDGWTNACTTTGPECSFTFTGTATATITFSKDAAEQWTRLLIPGNAFGWSAAFDSMNRPIVGTSRGVLALDANGATRWFVETIHDPADPFGPTTVSAAGHAIVDIDDNVIILSPRTLAKLGPDGQFQWSIDLGSYAINFSPLGTPFAVSPNGDIAVQNAQTLRVFSPAGILRWSATVPTLAIGIVAIDSAGNFSTMCEENGMPETMTVARYDPDGAPLSSPGAIAPTYHAALAIDSTGSFVTISSGYSSLYVQRQLANGSPGFVITKSTGEPSYVDNGVAVSDTDDIITVEALKTSSVQGFAVTRYSSIGDQTWHISRPAISGGYGPFGADARGVAVDHQGRVMVVGQFLGFQNTSVLVQLFAP